LANLVTLNGFTDFSFGRPLIGPGFVPVALAAFALLGDLAAFALLGDFCFVWLEGLFDEDVPPFFGFFFVTFFGAAVFRFLLASGAARASATAFVVARFGRRVLTAIVVV
jgi:hypothetical protein